MPGAVVLVHIMVEQQVLAQEVAAMQVLGVEQHLLMVHQIQVEVAAVFLN
jgi:hypothetical protein